MDQLDAVHETKAISVHRYPRLLEESNGKVSNGIAGLVTHLPGFIASRTTKPVIGVPVDVKLGGVDSPLSIVQMPPRVPVGCVTVDGGEKAAWLATRMLALNNATLQSRLAKMQT